jgi:hypothetical protein
LQISGSDTESESDDELEEVQGENISELHEYVPVMQVEDEDRSVKECIFFLSFVINMIICTCVLRIVFQIKCKVFSLI